MKHLILGFLLGIVFKIYDDLIDFKLDVRQEYVDFSCFTFISLIVILCHDPSFCITSFAICLLTFVMDKYYTCKLKENFEDSTQKNLEGMNDTLWLYTLFITGVGVMYHACTSVFTITIKSFTFVFHMILSLAIVFLDIYLTPEHASTTKLRARVGVLILLCFLLWAMLPYAAYFYDAAFSVMGVFIGFLIASISFLLLHQNGMLPVKN